MDQENRDLQESTEEQNITEVQSETPQFRGLYRHVKISVKTLDIIIVLGVIAIFACILFGSLHSGYTVTFDSNGGTDIPAQELRYGDLVTEPEAPTREGYTFDGWFYDENFSIPWDFAGQIVGDDVILYAKWIQNE